jgi:acetyltransferase-like isoleucine patch superfamily enzyme
MCEAGAGEPSAPLRASPGLLVANDVTIADDAESGGNVILHAGTRIDSGSLVGDGAVIGRQPRLGPMSSAP